MKKALVSMALLFQSCGMFPQAELPVAESTQPPPSHEQWDALVKAYVSEAGWVDYPGLRKDRSRLEGYLVYLSHHIPGSNWSREAQMAYFINLYNAATVQLILDHYPLGSIKEVALPWNRKFVRIGEEAYSLGTLEHKILREMGEPRIHFAINCASVSCPKLQNEAFSADRLDSQLEDATRGFITDPSRNRISGEKAMLSKIFKWYRKDFETDGRTLAEFLNPRLTSPLEKDVPIGYLPYDWSLNGQLP